MDNTANITPNSTDRPAQENRPTTPVVAAVGGLLGALLLIHAGPGLVSGLYASSASVVAWQIEQKQPVSSDRLAEAAAALRTANRWEPAAERLAMQAFLLIRQAEATVTENRREQLYDEATTVVERALALGPIQPHAWTMLAVLRNRTGDRRGAAAALRMSMLSGSVVPSLMVWRLKVALALRAWMDEDTLALLRRQIRLVWVMAPDQIARIGEDKVLGELVRRSLDDLSEEEINHFLNLHSNAAARDGAAR